VVCGSLRTIAASQTLALSIISRKTQFAPYSLKSWISRPFRIALPSSSYLVATTNRSCYSPESAYQRLQP